jgi:type II secretory pathway pseudopilin PulG
MPRPGRRVGVTLLELVVVVAVAATLSALALPALRALQHRWQVRQARDDLHGLLAAARWRAIAHRTQVTVWFGADGVVRAESHAWRLARPLAAAYGVTLRANRPSTAYGPDGLGLGAANLTIALRRGDAADSVVISRLGRVR